MFLRGRHSRVAPAATTLTLGSVCARDRPVPGTVGATLLQRGRRGSVEEHNGRRDHTAGGAALRVLSDEAAPSAAAAPPAPTPPRLRSILRVRLVARPIEAGPAPPLWAAADASTPARPASHHELELSRSTGAARLSDVLLAGSPVAHALPRVEPAHSGATRRSDAAIAAAPPRLQQQSAGQPVRRIKWGDEHGHVLATVSTQTVSRSNGVRRCGA
jgi:hypothetical protein